MLKKADIHPSDLFSYVFFIEELSEEKKRIILSEESFRKELDYYFSVKREMERQLPESIIEKLIFKVNSYKPEEYSPRISYN